MEAVNDDKQKSEETRQKMQPSNEKFKKSEPTSAISKGITAQTNS